MNFETARNQMLGQQVRAWEVLDDRVLGVMRRTPRERFVPEGIRELAFADTGIPIGLGESMMAPKVEGRMLQALDIEPVDRILEVGTGSGYMTACLARLGAEVRSVDIHDEFVTAAGRALAAESIDNVELNTADVFASVPGGDYDVIAVTGSMPQLDERFVRLLRPGGRLFVVVGRAPAMEATLVTMGPDGRWSERELFETVLKPLVNAESTEPFVL